MPKSNTYLIKPHNQIAKCIRDESITGLLWAFIQLSQHEIKQEGKSVTFSGSDLSRFVQLLHHREVELKLNKPETIDTSAVSVWLHQLENTDTKTGQNNADNSAK